MISADLQSLSPGNIVLLYELDTTVIGGTDILRFHPGNNILGNNVVWGGQVYSCYPVDATGFERTGSGTMPRPKLTVANVDGLIGKLGRDLGGLEGARLTRIRTFMKYLDGVNFPGGVNPTADPDEFIEKEIWSVARRSGENRIFVEYELAASFDLAHVKVPRRQVIQNVCTWIYRSGECSYAGPPVANQRDEPTSDIAQDTCGKRLGSCKLRFGENAVLPYGGFPAVGLMRRL